MSEARHLWSRGILGVAGLLGVAGVALGAASAHRGGGDIGTLASTFLLIHAGALPGILALRVGRLGGRLIATSLLAIGVAMFSGELAVLGFTGHGLVTGMAPAGGFLMIGGWAWVAGIALVGAESAGDNR